RDVVNLITEAEGPNTRVRVDITTGGVTERLTGLFRNEAVNRPDIEVLGFKAGGGDDTVTVRFGASAFRDVDIDGEDGNDTLDAATIPSNATLRGGPGNDTLIGGNQDDVFYGSAGMDSVVGNAGFDTYRWEGTDDANNIIIQYAFVAGVERLEAFGYGGDD